MIKRHWNNLKAGAGLLVVLSFALISFGTVKPSAAATNSAANEKIIQYVREKFGIPDAVKLSVAPFQDSEYTGFYKTVISVDDGKEKKAQPALITKDGRYMVLGSVVVASPTAQRNIAANASATNRKIVDFVRTQFKVPAEVKLTVGPFHDSDFADFYESTIYGQQGAGTKKPATPAYMTKDGRYAVIGSVYNLGSDPRREAESTISLRNQPTVGPADAQVTIVEFADLECPTCAEMQKFIETQLIPKYGNKVRVVFKEFPLVTIHDWSLQAAIANECGYEQNPATYVRYRSIIFESQGMINAANVRQLLLDFGQRVGLNQLKLSVCIDSKASLPRVEADMQEGRKLGIMSTPTTFINGTPVVGLVPDRIYALIDQALGASR
ncbi:MAG TPA: thioredoxin domain-containing protein [Terriglobia bacterium]|nr:thioredoxin domain-containing protein [Terriglobia bacterium]